MSDDGDGPVEALYAQLRADLPPDDAGQPPTLTEVVPGIRVVALRTPTLPPAAHTNVYLLGPAAGPVAVVDPGSPYPDQQAALDALLATIPGGVDLVLLTHHHADHTGGARALAERWGAPIAAHPATARRLAGRIAVARELVDGDTTHGAVALHTPGHADGHLVFEAAGATIAGDLVAGIGTILIDPDEGDMIAYLASLERLRARPPTQLLPAHGPAIADGPAKLGAYLAHRRMREDRVCAALAAAPAPRTARELVPEVYGDTPAPLWPLAERSLLAHLHKLVVEGRAFEGEGRYSARRWA